MADTHRPDVPTFFVEQCELRNTSAPLSSHRRTTQMSIDCRHWLERYRWVELEEAYDVNLNEFAPPVNPKFRFNDISYFRRLVQDELVVEEKKGKNIDEILVQLALEHLTLKNPAEPTCLLAPFIHPEVEVAENFFRRGKRKHPAYPINKRVAACLAPSSQSAIILSGYAPRIRDPVFVLARLKEDKVWPTGVVEVNFPLKYIVISLTPTMHDTRRSIEIGRMFGSFLATKHFRAVCTRATSSDEILRGVDAYLRRVTVEAQLAPQMIRAIRSRNDSEMSYWSDLFSNENEEEKGDGDEGDITEDVLEKPWDDKVEKGDDDDDDDDYADDLEAVTVSKSYSCCRAVRDRLWPPGRDLVNGLVATAKRYPSDFKDAFTKANMSVCFSSIPLIFFVVFGPAITLGTLMERQVDPRFSVSNSIIGSGLTTLLFAAFAGQPIAVIGPSGPGFIIERLISTEAKSYGIEFFAFRFWVLFYTMIFGMVFILLNLSDIALGARRSLEEVFSAFVSGFLIIKALFAIFKFIPSTLPSSNITLNPEQNDKLHFAAICGTNAFLALLMTCCCLVIAKFKTSHLIRRKIRFWIGAMNVPISICVTLAVERIWFSAYNVDLLLVPQFSKINCSTWFNFPPWTQLLNYGPKGGAAVHGRAVLFGAILAFLIFVEIALNSIVAIRGKSIKPSSLAMDHVLTNVVFPAMSMLLGLPLVSGVPVRTIANMMALAKVNPNPAPGTQGAVWYLVEQRVNTIIVGILVTLSVCLGDILHYIPVASLFGLFTFLGLFGLRGLRYKQVITAMLSRKKYWSQWYMVDGLPRRFVYTFTAIWLVELMVLFTLLILGEFEQYTLSGTVFPFFICSVALFREYVMPRWGLMAPYLEKMDPPCVPENMRKLKAK